MRLVRLALVALAFPPAAALASVSAEQVLAEAAELPVHVPGQYRTSLDLVEIDGSAEAKDFADLLRSEGKDELKNSDSCTDPALVGVSAGVPLVREILEDDCTFERFDVIGETVSAVVQCPAGGEQPDRVKMSGRMGAESVDLQMTVEQTLPDKTKIRMQMRIRSERVGACVA